MDLERQWKGDAELGVLIMLETASGEQFIAKTYAQDRGAVDVKLGAVPSDKLEDAKGRFPLVFAYPLKKALSPWPSVVLFFASAFARISWLDPWNSS